MLPCGSFFVTAREKSILEASQLDHTFDVREEKELRRGIIVKDLKHMPVAFAVMAALTLVVYFFNIPNPNIILITGLAVFTSLYGWFSGMVCSVIMFVYSMYFFSTDHSFFFFSDVNIQKMISILVGVSLTNFFVGLLKFRQSTASAKLERLNTLLSADNMTLKNASFTDVLTGVRNRLALRRDYDGFTGRSVDLLMLDVDDFKSINDRFGHQVGDDVLRSFGDLLAEVFGSDACYRFGGDEFVVISERTAETNFQHSLELLSEKLKELRLGRNDVPVHFSAGYVFGTVEYPYDLRFMLRQSDSLLYQSKREGKDRCSIQHYSREIASKLSNSVHYAQERINIV